MLHVGKSFERKNPIIDTFEKLGTVTLLVSKLEDDEFMLKYTLYIDVSVFDPKGLATPSEALFQLFRTNKFESEMLLTTRGTLE